MKHNLFEQYKAAANMAIRAAGQGDRQVVEYWQKIMDQIEEEGLCDVPDF